MEMMFVRLFNMGIQASIAIGVVLIVRELFRLMKVPKKFAYILWVIPFIRLVCPFNIESPFSIMPNMAEITDNMDISDGSYIYGQGDVMDEYSSGDILQENVQHAMSEDENVQDSSVVTDVHPVTEPSQITGEQPVTGPSEITDDQTGQNLSQVTSEQTGQNLSQVIGEQNVTDTSQLSDEEFVTDMSQISDQQDAADTIQQTQTKSKGITPLWIISMIWLVGLIGIVFYSVITLILLIRKLSINMPISDNVYSIDCIDTAFVLGITKPKIYVPSYIAQKDLEYVIAHERCHIRRLDYIIKPFAYFVGVLYWYNPIVWLAYHMMVRDMEMSCDETVLGNIGINKKKDYAKALLMLSSGKNYALSIPTAFAEGSTKGRVKNIMKLKKPLIIVGIIAVCVTGVLGVTLLTNPKESVETTTEATKIELVYGRYSMVLPEREEEITPYAAPYKEEYVFVPYVDIFEDGTAVFCYDPFNEFYPYAKGEYVIADNVLTMSAEGGRVFTFNISEDGSVAFDDNASYDMVITENDFTTDISDGTQFVFDEMASDDYLQTYKSMMVEATMSGFDLGLYFVEEVQYDNASITEDMMLGSDGVILDYADENIIIFHGYAGLFVYNRNTFQIQDSIDLAQLGLDKTQGDEYCEIFVSDDGQYVYFRPMENGVYILEELYNEMSGVTMDAYVTYRYHVEAKSMIKGPWETLFMYTTSIHELKDTSQCIEGIDVTQGFYSASCEEISDGVYGYLTCATGLWKDICYVESDMVYMMYDEEYFANQDEIQALIEEMETMIADAENNLDALLADELYQEVISKYNIAVYQGWSDEKMEQEGMCPYADRYSLYDVNMDGVNELLIGKKDVAGIMYDIYDIYTVENGELIQVTDGAETESYTFYESGIIKYEKVDYSTSDAREYAHYYLINGVLYDITDLGHKEILYSGEVLNNAGFVEEATLGEYYLIELEFTKFE